MLLVSVVVVVVGSKLFCKCLCCVVYLRLLRPACACGMLVAAVVSYIVPCCWCVFLRVVVVLVAAVLFVIVARFCCCVVLRLARLCFACVVLVLDVSVVR